MHQQAISTITSSINQADNKRSFMRLNTEKGARHMDRQRPLLSKAQSMAISSFTSNNNIQNNSSQDVFLTNNLVKQQNNLDSIEDCNGKTHMWIIIFPSLPPFCYMIFISLC